MAKREFCGNPVGTTANALLMNPGSGGITNGYDPITLAGYKNLSGSPIHPGGPRFECFCIASYRRDIGAFSEHSSDPANLEGGARRV